MSTVGSAGVMVLVAVVVGVVMMSVTPVKGTDRIVGANKGWNPGINYTLWASNHTFFVGDFISFRYKKNMYNVYEVNKTGYDNCTIQDAIGNWTSGKDFIHLTKPGKYYFICGTGSCFSGMKVSVVVHLLPPPPSSSVATTTHSSQLSESSAARAASRLELAVFWVMVIGLCLAYEWSLV